MNNSIWWHGLICFIIAGILGVILHSINYHTKLYIEEENPLCMYFWSATHIILYFIVTYLSPGQWPFWLALGILWEFFECYTLCWNKIKILESNINIPIGCSGFYDIYANIIGISLALLVLFFNR